MFVFAGWRLYIGILMTKIKIAIAIAIALAALAAPVVVQHQTIQQLRQENEGLKQQAALVAPLQDKLASASQEAARAGAPLSAAQMIELARLRNEVSQLRQQTNELARARQEIQVLNQRVASEAQASRNAAALQARAQDERGAANVCISNLRIIDASKAQWALENHKQNTDTPAVTDIQPYMGRGSAGEMPVCPDGGTYILGAVGEKPTCSIPGHVLP
jgi:hypothetical protein